MFSMTRNSVRRSDGRLPAYLFAARMISAIRAAVRLMSGRSSPLAARFSISFSAVCIVTARDAAPAISCGFRTSTPFSSARITSPGSTATPPQATGVQNSPNVHCALPVTVDNPRARTGMSYSRSSCTSVAGSSMTIPTHPAALAENATPRHPSVAGQ